MQHRRAGCSAQSPSARGGAGRELLYLVVRQKQQIPSSRICACLRKDEVAEDDLEVSLFGGPEDKLSFVHGKQLVKLTHSHQSHRILVLMRPTPSSHPRHVAG